MINYMTALLGLLLICFIFIFTKWASEFEEKIKKLELELFDTKDKLKYKMTLPDSSHQEFFLQKALSRINERVDLVVNSMSKEQQEFYKKSKHIKEIEMRIKEYEIKYCNNESSNLFNRAFEYHVLKEKLSQLKGETI